MKKVPQGAFFCLRGIRRTRSEAGYATTEADKPHRMGATARTGHPEAGGTKPRTGERVLQDTTNQTARSRCGKAVPFPKAEIGVGDRREETPEQTLDTNRENQYIALARKIGPLAQLAEQQTLNLRVQGSIP